MKPHTLAKEFIKPFVVDMADIILGDDTARKLKQVGLLNNTIRRKINDLSIDIRDQPMTDLEGFSSKNLASTGRFYRCIKLQSVNLLG